MASISPEPAEIIWSLINSLFFFGIIGLVVGLVLSRRRTERKWAERIAQLEARVELLERSRS